MIWNLIGWLLLLLVTAIFGWLVLRAWGARNAIVKWVGVVLAGLVTLILAVATILSAIGIYEFYVPGGSPVPNVKVEGTPAQITRGEHIANVLCAGCHSKNGELPLSGGRDVGADIPVPLGSFWSINLTPAGPLKDWSDGEIMRVLREGIDRDGKPLLVMSANSVRYFSDDDKMAVIAYLRNQPPVVNDTPSPADQPSFLATIFKGAGLIPRPAPVGAITAPPKGATAEYGAYITRWAECGACHGEDLSGGSGGLFPVGPNLRVVQGWTIDQFKTTLQTGVDPTGHSLSDEMPWKDFRKMDDMELSALYAYLKSLKPVQK
jgi:mono/diheme cytochrome c family protein